MPPLLFARKADDFPCTIAPIFLSFNIVKIMYYLRLSLLFLSAIGFLGLLTNSAEAQILGRRTASRALVKYCTPAVQTCYGPAVSLLAKDSLDNWTAPGGGQQQGGWSVVDGVLHLKGKGGDLVTERQYKNFVLDFEWTITKGGNSGIKYRYKRFDGHGFLGPEYQVLDDFGTSEGNRPTHSTASLYDILPHNSQKSLKPADQVNKGRIIVNGNRIEHWLNGKRVVCVVVGSKEWDEGIAASKFNGIEGFGVNDLGHIMVQDHGSEVWYHKITIREILPKMPVRKVVVSRTRCR